jgi:hypothetical protein
MSNKNIWLLPTDKLSRLHFDGKLFLSTNPQISREINSIVKGRNIYITSDEVPKLDEWGINLKNNVLFKCKGFEPDEYDKKYCKKIILTDNQDLIKYGVQSIDDEFLVWFIKNPSCESVEVEKGKEILGEVAGTTYIDFKYKIIIPKEEHKKEKLERKGSKYFKANAEEDYAKVPISVLRYISELEKEIEELKSK